MPFPPIGRALKHWRRQRNLSQLDLALQAGISARHLAFIETGRSRPSGKVVLRLAQALALSLRDRNALLEAAGLAPVYPETPLTSTTLAPFRRIVDLILHNHEPFPAFAFDRWWNIIDANSTARRIFPGLLELEALGMITMLYGPGPIRDMIVNWEEVAWAGLERIRGDAAATGHPEKLTVLIAQMERWLEGTLRPAPSNADVGVVACPVFRFGDQLVRTVTTVTTFSAALDVTLQELRIEQIFPLDASSEAFFRQFAEHNRS